MQIHIRALNPWNSVRHITSFNFPKLAAEVWDCATYSLSRFVENIEGLSLDLDEDIRAMTEIMHMSGFEAAEVRTPPQDLTKVLTDPRQGHHWESPGKHDFRVAHIVTLELDRGLLDEITNRLGAFVCARLSPDTVHSNHLSSHANDGANGRGDPDQEWWQSLYGLLEETDSTRPWGLAMDLDPIMYPRRVELLSRDQSRQRQM